MALRPAVQPSTMTFPNHSTIRINSEEVRYTLFVTAEGLKTFRHNEKTYKNYELPVWPSLEAALKMLEGPVRFSVICARDAKVKEMMWNAQDPYHSGGGTSRLGFLQARAEQQRICDEAVAPYGLKRSERKPYQYVYYGTYTPS